MLSYLDPAIAAALAALGVLVGLGGLAPDDCGVGLQAHRRGAGVAAQLHAVVGLLAAGLGEGEAVCYDISLGPTARQ